MFGSSQTARVEGAMHIYEVKHLHPLVSMDELFKGGLERDAIPLCIPVNERQRSGGENRDRREQCLQNETLYSAPLQLRRLHNILVVVTVRYDHLL